MSYQGFPVQIEIYRDLQTAVYKISQINKRFTNTILQRFLRKIYNSQHCDFESSEKKVSIFAIKLFKRVVLLNLSENNEWKIWFEFHEQKVLFRKSGPQASAALPDL